MKLWVFSLNAFGTCLIHRNKTSGIDILVLNKPISDLIIIYLTLNNKSFLTSSPWFQFVFQYVSRLHQTGWDVTVEVSCLSWSADVVSTSSRSRCHCLVCSVSYCPLVTRSLAAGILHIQLACLNCLSEHCVLQVLGMFLHVRLQCPKQLQLSDACWSQKFTSFGFIQHHQREGHTLYVVYNVWFIYCWITYLTFFSVCFVNEIPFDVACSNCTLLKC